MIRGVSRITISRGVGRGAALGLGSAASECGVPATPCARRSTVASIRHRWTASSRCICWRTIRNCQKPLTDNADTAGAGDWYVLIDGTDIDAVAATIKARFDHALVSRFATLVSSGTYRLMWDLAKSEIPT